MCSLRALQLRVVKGATIVKQSNGPVMNSRRESEKGRGGRTEEGVIVEEKHYPRTVALLANEDQYNYSSKTALPLLTPRHLIREMSQASHMNPLPRPLRSNGVQLMVKDSLG